MPTAADQRLACPRVGTTLGSEYPTIGPRHQRRLVTPNVPAAIPRPGFASFSKEPATLTTAASRHWSEILRRPSRMIASTMVTETARRLHPAKADRRLGRTGQGPGAGPGGCAELLPQTVPQLNTFSCASATDTSNHPIHICFT